MFLGGHDHDYEIRNFNDKWLIKSGADFRDLSLIEMNIDFEAKMNKVTKIEHYFVESIIPEKIEIKEIVDKYTCMEKEKRQQKQNKYFFLSRLDELNKELDVVLGEMNTELDGRFSKIRSQETNLGIYFRAINQ